MKSKRNGNLEKTAKIKLTLQDLCMATRGRKISKK